ncbi:MAG: hypothetical protein O3A08_11985 [Proteobacteria bacterium]|nr:hypothetical protein [Pseudomonadota bacterium]MDA1287118.1 hypothetical protein [Pseudomonadota bacterium]
MTTIKSRAARTARVHFRRILILLGLMVAVIIGLNNLTFYLIRQPQNVGTAQMIYGWARLYKPMIYDSVDAKSVSFGFSWVRDIFDPVKVEDLTGETFFNFGISGATSFESYRLIQNMLKVHRPEQVFLDLESFYDAPMASRVEHQFDERILYINRDGSVNPTAKMHRLIKINTSGAALGFNFAFLETLYKQRAGVPIESLLPSYQRRDWRAEAKLIADMKTWMTVPSVPSDSDRGKGGNQVPQLNDLAAAVTLLCDAQVDIHLYEAPYICGGDGTVSRTGLALMQRLANTCKSNITYHSFRYPNAVTMEGMVREPAPSLFYRPDGHPRPSLGQMMLTRILSLQDEPGAPPLPKDFGADLMAMSDAEAQSWISNRAARCYGTWADGELDATIAEAKRLMPDWESRF